MSSNCSLAAWSICRTSALENNGTSSLYFDPFGKTMLFLEILTEMFCFLRESDLSISLFLGIHAISLIFWAFRILSFFYAISQLGCDWYLVIRFLWRTPFLWILTKLTSTPNVCVVSSGIVAAKSLLGLCVKLYIRMLSPIDLNRRSVISMSIMDILRSIQLTTDGKSSNSMRELLFSVFNVLFVNTPWVPLTFLVHDIFIWKHVNVHQWQDVIT